MPNDLVSNNKFLISHKKENVAIYKNDERGEEGNDVDGRKIYRNKNRKARRLLNFFTFVQGTLSKGFPPFL